MQGPARSLRAKDTTIAEFLGNEELLKEGLGKRRELLRCETFQGSVKQVMESVSKGREIVVNGRVSVEGGKAKMAPTSSSAW